MLTTSTVSGTGGASGLSATFTGSAALALPLLALRARLSRAFLGGLGAGSVTPGSSVTLVLVAPGLPVVPGGSATGAGSGGAGGLALRDRAVLGERLFVCAI